MGLINYINNKFNLGLSTSNVNFQTNSDLSTASDGNDKQNKITICQTNMDEINKFADNDSTPMDQSSECSSNCDNASCSTQPIDSNYDTGDSSNKECEPFSQTIEDKNKITTLWKNLQIEQCVKETLDKYTSKHKSSFHDSISNEIYYHALQLEYTRNPLKSSEQDMRKRLNNLEQVRLQEVNQHFKSLYATEIHENKKIWIKDAANGFHYFESVIKKIIISIKNIQSFKSLCQDDQIVLLKKSVGPIKTLVNIRYFNPSQSMCITPNPHVSLVLTCSNQTN